jgi:hypothetical protein
MIAQDRGAVMLAELESRAVLRGAAVGLAVVVPVTIGRALLARDVTDFGTSGWVVPLAALILVAYAAAGVTAARSAGRAALRHGAAAGLATVVAWLPIRVLVWALREGDRGLVTGNRAALPVGQVLGALALAAVLGAAGGTAAGRAGRPAPATDRPGVGERAGQRRV